MKAWNLLPTFLYESFLTFPNADLYLILPLCIVCNSEDKVLGTGVDAERDVMDNCTGATGPRPVNEVFSPGRTDLATIDDVNGGYCGVDINTPGIWWW